VRFLSLSILNLLPFVALLVPTTAVLLAFSLENASEVGRDEHFRRLSDLNRETESVFLEVGNVSFWGAL
jgi:hypothetical protein